MVQRPTDPEFSRPVEAERIGPEGYRLTVEATETERTALARRFGILRVNSLTAEVTLRPDARPGFFRMAGQLAAQIEQACVVSLEPVQEEVKLDFTRLYAQPDLIETQPVPDPDDEDLADWLDPEADDPPDSLVDGKIDAGEAIAEELALGMNPYPRRPDAEVPAAYKAFPEDGEKITPFAQLAQLKSGKNPKGKS